MAQVGHESEAERVGIHSVQSQFGRSADCGKLADGMIRFLLCMLKRRRTLTDMPMPLSKGYCISNLR
jgi:hypothetical protein